jgi:tRNA(Ile)-lysidine synthase
MWSKVCEYIKKHKLLEANELYLVALSGGADSVALLLLLKEGGFNVHAAHCNFHLRGAESDRDEAFCVELCQQLGVELHRAHFDTREYAELHKVSIEMAARELRYKWFDQLRQDMGAAGICVAHHRDDSVETVLLNLVRGTGLRGLTGIQPRNGFILRPFLCV